MRTKWFVFFTQKTPTSIPANQLESAFIQGNNLQSVRLLNSPDASKANQFCNGLYHTCLVDNGKVFCWGSNQYAELGQDSAVQNWGAGGSNPSMSFLAFHPIDLGS